MKNRFFYVYLSVISRVFLGKNNLNIEHFFLKENIFEELMG